MGELHGLQWQPRDLGDLFYRHGWKDVARLTEALQVCFAESAGYDRAFNDNLDEHGKVSSRDVGLMQINIPAHAIGTSAETDLYDAEKNANAAWVLYSRRGWQPWASWNSAAVFQDRCVRRAVLGVGNFAGALALEAQSTIGVSTGVRGLVNPILSYRVK